MHIKNSSGSTTDSCGTPLRIGESDDKIFVVSTTYWLSLR